MNIVAQLRNWAGVSISTRRPRSSATCCLGDDASVWPGAVVRGDVHHVRIGARTNIQDGAIIHVTHDGPFTPGGHPCLIGSEVTIGHGAVVHACTLEDACMIGMNATILDGAVIKRHAFVGRRRAGAAGQGGRRG